MTLLLTFTDPQPSQRLLEKATPMLVFFVSPLSGWDLRFANFLQRMSLFILHAGPKFTRDAVVLNAAWKRINCSKKRPGSRAQRVFCVLHFPLDLPVRTAPTNQQGQHSVAGLFLNHTIQMLSDIG